jgi:phosphotransferase system enzyme I (PtsI)
MSLQLNGIGVSKGTALGRAIVIQRGQVEVAQYSVTNSAIIREQNRLRKAIEIARQQLGRIRDNMPTSLPADISSFIDSHMLMLDDPALTSVPLQLIAQQNCNAEWALKLQYDSLIRAFDEIDDEYLKTRVDDIRYVVNRLQRTLIEEASISDIVGEDDLSKRIIVADDLSPTDIVQMHQKSVRGFITEFGGPLSHVSILARSLQIPAIAGMHNAHNLLQPGEEVIIDGDLGIAIAKPTPKILTWYRQRTRAFRRKQRDLQSIKDEPAITKDGQRIQLQANIELPEDIRAARKFGCDGIGLFRTEYLYINRPEQPSEDEQFRAYRQAIRAMKGKPVTIRTFDLGADKQVDSGRTESPVQTNPALGLRAVRLCLREQEMFITQLKAIIRASKWGNVRIVIPMISNLQELQQVLALIGDIKKEFDRNNIRYADFIPVGIMIEVPATAIAADAFARHCDFLSIGTNDLIPYTLAIDRVDDTVNYLYDPMHPAVLHLIKLTIDAGRKAGIPVSMCGEMAGDSYFTRLLLGLGLDELSMQPSTLLEVKSIINKTDKGALKRQTEKILRAKDTTLSHGYLDELNKQ